MKYLNLGNRRNIQKRIIIFIIAFIVLIYLLFSFGFKLLLNGSVFIASLFNKNEVAPLTKNEDVYGSVSIDNIEEATNSAEIVISGSVVNYSILRFYLNGEKIDEKEIRTSDTFTQIIENLNKGTNEIYVKALTKDGKNSKKTETYYVIFDDEKPKLELTEPTGDTKVNKPDITIKGKTDKEIYININNAPVVVDANGAFQYQVRLIEGENTFNIQASDIAGNVENKTLKIIYQKEE